MASISLMLKANAIKTAIEMIFGFSPIMKVESDYVEFSFTPEQQVILERWLETQMAKKTPSEIRFKLAPVIIPFIIKKGAPYLTGSAILGYFLGTKK